MKTAVLGIGSLGTVVGALIVQSGRDVVLIDVDEKNVAALNGPAPGHHRSGAEWRRRSMISSSNWSARRGPPSRFLNSRPTWNS